MSVFLFFFSSFFGVDCVLVVYCVAVVVTQYPLLLFRWAGVFGGLCYMLPRW